MTLITHFIIDSNISNEYITFINKEFDSSEHNFITLNKHKLNYLAPQVNLVKISSKAEYIKLIFLLHQSKKILIHGLFDSKVIMILFMMPWLLKKCSWVIWGGDLYGDILNPVSTRSKKYQLFFKLKKFVVSRFFGYVTYIKGDYEIAKNLYDSKAKYQECIMYLSNVFKPLVKSERLNNRINILVGNSAAKTNNHLDIFEKLSKENLTNYEIICPLNYGDMDYAKNVIAVGNRLFGVNFIPLTEFMPLDKYLKLLSSVDVAIFNHNRQQGMGNTISLLGMGKVVYIRDDITTWQFFQNIGVNVSNSSNECLEIQQALLNSNSINIQIIEKYFSIDNLIKQSSLIFKGQ